MEGYSIKLLIKITGVTILISDKVTLEQRKLLETGKEII